MPHTSLDIVVPCYNPKSGWEQVLLQHMQALQQDLAPLQVGCVVVNDGSEQGVTTQSATLLQSRLSPCIWLEHQVNRGKGSALRSGMNASEADLLVYTDIDFPYTYNSLLQVCQNLMNNRADVVAGIKDPSYYQKTPAFRRVISKLLRRSTRLLLQLPVDDTQCGLKGMNRAGKEIFLQTRINRYLFDLEFIARLTAHPHLRLKTVEVILRDGVVFSSMPLRVMWREGINFLHICTWRLANRVQQK